jgi:hypothetical protein
MNMFQFDIEDEMIGFVTINCKGSSLFKHNKKGECNS